MTDANFTEELIIDPLAMNIVNRVAPGSSCSGTFCYEGGVLIQGRVDGTIQVTGGPLVLMPEGELAGDVVAKGEAYLFGAVHASKDGALSELDVQEAVFLASSLKAQANITAGAIKSYEGAQVEGRIKTVRREG